MSPNPRRLHHTYTHFTLCAGAGGISLGLNRATASVGRFTASLRCIGAIDVDPAACRDLERLTGTRATCLDLFDLEDFRAFHGPCKTAKRRCKVCRGTGEPPEGWREATPDDVRAAAGGESPDIVAWSPPCKGFSGLLNEKSAKSARYQALNNLTVRALVLALEAFADDSPSLVIMENVPRIATRGRQLVDTICGILRAYGYAVTESTHDCGEVGGLAQHRKRFLLVGRHLSKVKPFVYEPPKRRVRGVGEVLGELPMPDDIAGGTMHRLPRLQWKTWVRLALIEAGKDWRSLTNLSVVDGMVEGLRIAADVDWHRGVMGVVPWNEPLGTVTGRSTPTTGRFTVADPRCPSSRAGAGKHRVTGWEEPAGTVIAGSTTGHGANAIADPRPPRDLGRFEPYGVTKWDESSGTVTSQAAPGSGHFSVADPRLDCDVNDRKGRRHCNVYRVIRWDEAATTVTGAAGNARPNIADPRPTWSKTTDGAWSNSGHFGVRRWDQPSASVVGNAKHDKGAWSVADRRLPEATEQCAPCIVALDGTWHRPFTTYELAIIQGFPAHLLDGSPLTLDGRSDSDHRMRIGNAVPPPTFQAIGGVFLDALLRQQLGQTFALSALPVWVQPTAVALSVEGGLQ